MSKGYVLTKDMIEERIAEVKYYYHGVLTICVMEMENGFYHVGKSACISPVAYKKDVGEEFSYEDALRQAWSYEAYLMKEYDWEDDLEVL